MVALYRYHIFGYMQCQVWGMVLLVKDLNISLRGWTWSCQSPFSTKNQEHGHEFENPAKQLVKALVEFSKLNERCSHFILASQSANTEVARATLVVQRATKVIDVVSMYHEKLKEASKEVSRKFGGKEFQENVSFVAFLKPWNALTKNSVALKQTAENIMKCEKTTIF